MAKNIDGTGLRTSYLVECKKNRSDRKVEIAVARQLLQVKTDKNVSHAIIATTSDFSTILYKYATECVKLIILN